MMSAIWQILFERRRRPATVGPSSPESLPEKVSVLRRAWLSVTVFPPVVATVILDGIDAVTVETGEDGLVKIGPVAAGTYRLRVLSPGFVAFDTTIELLGGTQALPITLVPTIPRSRHALQGTLQISHESYTDDTGSVLPIFCHAGDLLSLFARDSAWALAELDDIATAGYAGVRTWTWLDGVYWERLGRVFSPTRYRPEDYEEIVRLFARSLRVRGVRWIVSQGDMLRFAPDRRGFMVRLAEILAEEGGTEVVCAVDGGNEAWQNGETDPGRLRAIVDAFRAVLPVPVWSLTSPPGEDPSELDEYAGTVYDVHGARHGRYYDWIRHAFSIAYEGKPACRLGIQSEPPGPGPLVSAVHPEAKRELDDEAMCVLAAMHLMARQATVFMSSPGVSVRERGEFRRQPGFTAVPRLAEWLPEELMRYERLFHGGEVFRGQRVCAAVEDVRCDHAMSHDGRFMVCIYGPPGAYRIPIERRCEATVHNPATGESIQRLSPSDTELVVEFARGRVVLGTLQEGV
jgi:hypothetical protein